MFQAVLELPLVSVTVDPHVHPVPMDHALDPGTDVLVALRTLPETATVLVPVIPLSIIDLPIAPDVPPSAMPLTV
jgi:hypothetical protein